MENNQEFTIDVEKTKKMLERLKCGDGKRIKVNAKDKEFYDICPHCSSEFYYKFDNVTFIKEKEFDLENLDVEDMSEMYSKLFQSIMNHNNGSSKRNISCPVCEGIFNPNMKTKDDFIRSQNPMNLFGGMGIGNS